MKVIFLDRDGVINQDRDDYVKEWAEFEFIPGSLEAIKELTEHGFRPIVITNQSAINRNMMTRKGLEDIFENMKNAVAAYGGWIEDIFYCPHVPEDGCDCRKPEPGLLYQARDAYGIDLATTYMIGDNLKDMQCARAAGCGKAVLVRTGHGKETERVCNELGMALDYIADNLLDVARWLLL